MATLYELCLKNIVNHDLSTIGLPDIIKTDIKILKINKENKDEVSKTCCNTVSKIKKIEESREFDLFGYIDGIQLILQNKNYMSRNAIFYENEAKRGIYNCGHMHRSLMLYYVKQESDFNLWYKKSKTRCWHCPFLDKIGA